MKYCSHCGKELVDEAVVCTNCGCAVLGAEVSTTNNEGEKETIRTIAKILMIFACVCALFAGVIPLAWCIPMTVKYWKAVENHEKVSTAFKVCTLLFVNVIAGILMLIDD